MYANFAEPRRVRGERRPILDDPLTGKWRIHPSQVEIANRVLWAMDQIEAKGVLAFATNRGVRARFEALAGFGAHTAHAPNAPVNVPAGSPSPPK